MLENSHDYKNFWKSLVYHNNRRPWQKFCMAVWHHAFIRIMFVRNLSNLISALQKHFVWSSHYRYIINIWYYYVIFAQKLSEDRSWSLKILKLENLLECFFAIFSTCKVFKLIKIIHLLQFMLDRFWILLNRNGGVKPDTNRLDRDLRHIFIIIAGIRLYTQLT